MPKRFLLDTNLLVRFLIEDDTQKAQAVGNLLGISDDKLIVTDLAFAEVAWVMVSLYKLPKKEIVQNLASILNFDSLVINRRFLANVLEIYSKYNVDFIDAYHAAFMKKHSLKKIYSYDKDFDKFNDLERIEP